MLASAKNIAGGSADELRQQYRLMELKRMLLQYGIHLVNVSDMSLARRFLRAVAGHMESPTPTALRDGLQIVGAYHYLSPRDVYLTRLRQLSTHGRLTAAEAEAVVAGLPPGEAVQPILETLGWLEEALADLAVPADVSAAPAGVLLGGSDDETPSAAAAAPGLVPLAAAARARAQVWVAAARVLWGLLLSRDELAHHPLVAARRDHANWWAAQEALLNDFGAAAPWAGLATVQGRRALLRAYATASHTLQPSGAGGAATATGLDVEEPGRSAPRRQHKTLAWGSMSLLRRLGSALSLPAADLLAALAAADLAHGEVARALDRCAVRMASPR